MKAKINNFYNLLNEFRYTFQRILKSKPESYDDEILLLESIYSNNKQQFPFDIKTAFEDLYTENPDKMELIFWDKLKESYYNYEQFIELDYQYFRNSELPTEFQDLFYYSKLLSYNYFAYVSRIYYWYYGRKNESRGEKKQIIVGFLNDYSEKIPDLDNDNATLKIRNYFSFHFDMVENYVKYIYAKNDFVLKITKFKSLENGDINGKIEKVADKYYSKLEELVNYKENITKLALNLRFEYPDYLRSKDTFVKKAVKSQETIKFLHPENVFDSLSPYIHEEFIEPLRKLIFGEKNNVDKEITFRGSSNMLVYFFKQLYDGGHLIADSKEQISEWIIKNFMFYDEEDYKKFKKDTIQKTLMRDCKPPKREVKYLI
ncbi:hypothetical protein BOQ62_10645 [Chryseobacterium sp. CH21]|uniref:hypothetical protein n=1 Tax=Chryseobacterium sp. CH21 TaxID=713556 RepID=UPI00100A5E0A|nr:hypothetical protein [Chryseobacterium sp. CH21]RXM39622.1 hypothetical protein BOQ62_10645 [Chryseobacterium sp. CH21]